MKLLKRILTGALCLLLCLSLSPAALASGADADIPAYSGESWEDYVAALLERYGVSPDRVYIGYMDLVTGEEHYMQGDEYAVAASMYKLPLCMAIVDSIAAGELDWDLRSPNVSLEYIFNSVLVDSENEPAGFLYDMLDGYSSFRRLAAEAYLDTDPAAENEELYFDNRFTPRQMISCLKQLYDRQEDFALVLDCLRRAEPERFFNYYQQDFDVAHKYGFWQDEYFLNVWTNDCGIVFTDEPIALVMFTNRVATEQDYELNQKLLSYYCAAMCEYSQYQSALGAQRAQGAAQEEAAELASELTAEPLISPAPIDKPSAPAPTAIEEDTTMPILPCILILALTAALALLAVKCRKKYRLGLFWALICVAVMCVALLLSVVALNTGTIISKPKGDPQQTVSRFFDAVKAQDYPTAYTCLRDYSSLGLEDEPSSEAGKLVCSALRQSYDYELLGDCSTDRLSAVQRVSMSYLDLSLLHSAVEEGTMQELKSIVQSRPRKEVYDGNDQYLPEVANEAYLRAVSSALAQPEQFYSQTELELKLSYSGGSWQMSSDPALLKALNGGAAY